MSSSANTRRFASAGLMLAHLGSQVVGGLACTEA